jgi:hypothetical protein
MKVLTWLSSLLGFSLLSNAWVLDESCRDYDSRVRDIMIGAFDLNFAALQTMHDLQNRPEGGIAQAQGNLRQWMFPSTSNAQSAMTVANVYKQIYEFSISHNGHPQEHVGPYSSLGAQNFVVYCDFSRFDIGRTCQGNQDDRIACDRHSGGNVQRSPAWEACRSGNGNVVSNAGVSFVLFECYRKIFETEEWRGPMC